MQQKMCDLQEYTQVKCLAGFTTYLNLTLYHNELAYVRNFNIFLKM